MARSSLTLRTARWSAEHPWRALFVWVLFVAAAVAAGSTMTTVHPTAADYRVGNSGVADKLITEAGLAGAPTESVLITARSSTLSPAAATSAASDVRRRMRMEPLVRSVHSTLWSPGHDAALVVMTLRGDADDDLDVTALQAATDAVQHQHRDLVVAEVGDSSLNTALGDRVGSDLSSAERTSLPVTLILMLLAFGALIAAGLPVLLAISAVVATIGLLAPLSQLIPMDDTVASMVLLIGMAVGVDYSLFYLKRAREERRRGRTVVDAVEIAAATSGHSIVVSGAAVMVAMAGLYIADDVTFASLASGAIIVVAVAVVGSLTVLPAMLAKLGRWVDRPRIPFLSRAMTRVEPGGISRRILGPVTRRPLVSMVLALVVLLGLAVPALGMKVHESTITSIPQDIAEVQTLQAVETLFPSQGDTLQVVVPTSPHQLQAATSALAAVARAASTDADFLPAKASDIRISMDHTVAVLTLGTPYAEGSAEAERSLHDVRDVLGPRYLDPLSDARWVVGGGIAQSYDDTQHQQDKLPYVIAFVLLLTLLMMGLTFRSVPIALLTTLLNLLSVGAAFGVLTLVFQHSWADGLLGYTSSGFVVSWIPLFTFVVLMGLSMDYHVFVLSRVREYVVGGLPPRLAVEYGVSQTAGVVTSAAAVMVSVFAIFASLSLLELKQIGVDLAVAVLIDATLVRVVLLPAALILLGHLAWWPMRTPQSKAAAVVVPVDSESAPTFARLP